MSTITAVVYTDWETLTNIIKTKKSAFTIGADTTYELQNVGGGAEIQVYEGATAPSANEIGGVLTRTDSMLYKATTGEVLYLKAKGTNSNITLVIKA